MSKGVLSRFGYLVTQKYPNLLEQNPDLLLAASQVDSSEKMILKIEKGSRKN